MGARSRRTRKPIGETLRLRHEAALSSPPIWRFNPPLVSLLSSVYLETNLPTRAFKCARMLICHLESLGEAP